MPALPPQMDAKKSRPREAMPELQTTEMGHASMAEISRSRGALRENVSLVHRALGKVNGGNNHRWTAIIRGYQLAIDYANDQRCKDRTAARARVKVAEKAVEEFCCIS